MFLVNNTNTNEVVPDIVMDTAEPKETVVENPELEEPIPKESPPPYSEIDPMKKPKERPSSLDISVEETEPDVEEQSNTDLEVPEGKNFVYKSGIQRWLHTKTHSLPPKTFLFRSKTIIKTRELSRSQSVKICNLHLIKRQNYLVLKLNK